MAEAPGMATPLAGKDGQWKAMEVDTNMRNEDSPGVELLQAMLSGERCADTWVQVLRARGIFHNADPSHPAV